MAVSTHRWRPSAATKSGYALRRTPRKLKSSVKKDDRCIIEMKFEKSRYFAGSGISVEQVFREDGADLSKNSFVVAAKYNALAPISRVSTASTTQRSGKVISMISGERQSSINFTDTLGDFLLKKLYASEYVEAKSLKYLTKVKDPVIRCYIISTDLSCIEESINILEIIKLNLNSEDWLSFKIILLEKQFDIKNEILSKEESKPSQKPFVIKTNVVEESLDNMDDDMDEDDADEFDKESTSTSTIYDEDEETRMIGKMASSKFRDSRIIIKNKNKPKQPEMDPVERCFLALMKMLQDNIFSATKGLNELNLQITHMLNEGDIDFDDIVSPHDQHIKIFKL